MWFCIGGESGFPENALVKALRNLHAKKKSQKGKPFFFFTLKISSWVNFPST